MYTCTHASPHITHSRAQIYTRIHSHTLMHTYNYTYTSTPTHLCTRAFTPTWAHTLVHPRILTHTHSHHTGPTWQRPRAPCTSLEAKVCLAVGDADEESGGRESQAAGACDARGRGGARRCAAEELCSGCCPSPLQPPWPRPSSPCSPPSHRCPPPCPHLTGRLQSVMCTWPRTRESRDSDL